MFRRLVYVFTACCFSLLPSYAMPGLPDSLRKEWQYNTEKGAYADVIRSASEAYYNENDSLSPLSMQAAVMAGQAYGMLSMKDSMELWLSRALEAGLLRDDAWVQGAVYNSLAKYAMDSEGNFYKSISYFIKGLEVTEGRAASAYYALESNLALVYYLRNDPDGLKYAEDVLRYGTESDNPYYIFAGSLTSSYFLHAAGENERALAILSPVVDSIDNFYNHAAAYTLYADILGALGNPAAEVEKYHLLALSHTDSTDEKSCSDAYYNYGMWLIGQGREKEASALVSEGTGRIRQPLYRYRLYEVLSRASRAAGDYPEALYWFEKYYSCSDSLFLRDREYSVNELFIRYETEKYRKDAYENEIRLLNVSRKMYVIAMAAVIVLVSFGAFIVFHIRKNRKYKMIARKYKALVETEKANEGPCPAAGSDDVKMHGLFMKVEELMKNGAVYRDKDISVVSLAGRLGSNRTYLSNCINRFSGMTFTSYINSFRIAEAVKILSDTGCDMPLKKLSDRLGFNDISTFYRAFRTVVGMPPSRFRQEMQRLAE